MDYLNQLGNQNIQAQQQKSVWPQDSSFAARYLKLSDFASSQPPVPYAPSSSDSISFSPAAMQQMTQQEPVAETQSTQQAQQVDTKQLEKQRTIDFIDNYLKQKKSPAANYNTGEMMVKYGEEHNIDPKVLLAIAGTETGYGKTGIGHRGMLGVGAYDNNPKNAVNNSKFSGVENQIKVGAKTFEKLRKKGKVSDKAPIATQLSAVNKAGWSTTPTWHNVVNSVYKSINKAEATYNKQHPIEQQTTQN